MCRIPLTTKTNSSTQWPVSHHTKWSVFSSKWGHLKHLPVQHLLHITLKAKTTIYSISEPYFSIEAWMMMMMMMMPSSSRRHRRLAHEMSEYSGCVAKQSCQDVLFCVYSSSPQKSSLFFPLQDRTDVLTDISNITDTVAKQCNAINSAGFRKNFMLSVLFLEREDQLRLQENCQNSVDAC